MSTPDVLTATKAIIVFREMTSRAGFVGRFADAVLMDMTGCSEDEANDALDAAVEAGAVECGVSSRTGWLTNRGRALLQTGVLPRDYTVIDQAILATEALR